MIRIQYKEYDTTCPAGIKKNFMDIYVGGEICAKCIFNRGVNEQAKFVDCENPAIKTRK